MKRRAPFFMPLVAVVLGVGVGALTSVFQAYLDFPWLALVNAVSPWVTTAFVAGALQSRLRTAVWTGLLATLVQVVAYYAVAELRGYDASVYYLAFWSVCALVGGPLFGAAGHAWRHASPAGLGAAALSAVYLSEALVTYQIRLGYTSTAVLFGALGLALAVVLGRHRQQYGAMVRWLGPALVAGSAGAAVLTLWA
ncbi:DUF6518 family protein [Mumia zhuanghuii]|uniref:Uncharacterized protein n=1 Tax=Mumia zhuanghuii TaxID=2585211 RepID=A0A5C4MPV5_9ACTN|nr:DUF6518 family protein [Mumia zhuanghuii]TNC46242.1 hypothetical protein FHE65_13350 [Mumia zhuanghuii]TNC47330.1 hypothetical protein FHE65_09935 [Mumia zhuanghuii]